jgi:GlpG protein
MASSEIDVIFGEVAGHDLATRCQEEEQPDWDGGFGARTMTTTVENQSSPPNSTAPLASVPGTASRAPLMTAVACAACLIVFAGIIADGAGRSWEGLAKWGYLEASRIWDGAYWALLTSAFVHIDPLHLAFNVYWLWHLGAAVERTLGRAQWLAFVVAAAVLSSADQLAGSGTTGHGASGVAYALFGFMWMGRRDVPSFATVLQPKVALLFWAWLVGCVVATRLGIANVGNGAHIGGLVFGLLVGAWFFSRVPRRVVAIAMAVFVAVSVTSLFWNPWSATWVGYKAYQAQVAGQNDIAISRYRRYVALGGDRVWALGNLARAYVAKGSRQEYASTLAELEALDRAAAAEVREESEKPAER